MICWPTSFKGIKCIFFHLSIPAIVAKVTFSKGGMCVGVLAQYHCRFNPIPLPLIAYGGTLVQVILLSSLLSLLMSSVQGTWCTPRIHHWSLEQRSLYSWGLLPCVSAMCWSPGASDQGISADVWAFVKKHLQPLYVSTSCSVTMVLWVE